MAGPNAGRRGRRWETLKANLRAQRRPCWLCGQPIDYTLQWPDLGSFSVDHRTPREDAPHLAEDPANLAAAHLGCNTTRGKRDPSPSLGSSSRRW